MNKVTGLVFFFYVCFFILFSVSCCTLKRNIKITETEIDTVIVVIKDTITIHDTVNVNSFLQGDTLKAENEISKARAFYNVTTQKIELQLKGKIFELPVKLHKIVIEKIPVKKTDFKFWFFIGLLSGIIFLLFIYILIKKLL